MLVVSGAAVALCWCLVRVCVPLSHPVCLQAIKQLVGFERVRLAPGQSKTVKFGINVRMLSTVDKHGVRHSLAGPHELIISRGHGEELRHTVTLGAAADAGGRVVL